MRIPKYSQIVFILGILVVVGCVVPKPTTKQEPTLRTRTTKPTQASLEQLIESEQWQDALALINRQLQTASGDDVVRLTYLQGVCLYHLGKLDQAKTLLEKVALEYPGNPWESEAFALLEQIEKERTSAKLAAPTAAMKRFAELCEAYRSASVQSKAQAITTVEEFLATELSFDELVALAETPPPEPELATPLLLAAAQYAYHVGNRAICRKFVNTLTQICNTNSCKWRAKVEVLVRELSASAQPNMLAVGVILPLSGRFKTVGERVLSAIKLGLGELDQAPPQTAQAKIELFVCDDGADATKAQECVDELVLEKKVAAILGPVLSKPAYRAALRAQWFGVPIISFSMREELPSLGSFVFRVALTPRLEAEALAKYAVKVLGLRKFAIIYPSDLYGVSMMNYFWDAAKRAAAELDPPERIEITACETYPNGITDFTFYVKRMTGRLYPNLRYEFIKFKKEEREKYTNPYRWRKAVEKFLKELPPITDFDAIFIPDTARVVSMIVPTLAYEGLDMHTTKKWKLHRLRKRAAKQQRAIKLVWLLGPSTWHSNLLLERAGKFIEESVFCDAFYKERDDEQTKQFVNEYLKRFNTEPSTLEAFAYDTAGMLKTLLVGANPPKSRSQLRDLLLSDKTSYAGVTGTLRFDQTGELAPELFMLSYYDGEVVPADQIKPEKRRDIVYPPAKSQESSQTSGGTNNGQ